MVEGTGCHPVKAVKPPTVKTWVTVAPVLWVTCEVFSRALVTVHVVPATFVTNINSESTTIRKLTGGKPEDEATVMLVLPPSVAIVVEAKLAKFSVM